MSMFDEGGPKPQQQIPFDEAVQIGLSRRGIGDTKNNFQKIQARLEIPEFWPKVKLAQTYDGYVREKYQNRPDIAEAVIAGSDKWFVQKYDALAQRVNTAIGAGVTTQEQAGAVGIILQEVDTFIADYFRVLDYIGPRGISEDAVNPPFAIGEQLLRPKWWPDIKPLPTYEQYTKGYIPSGMTEYAEKITNKALVAEYNAVILRINKVIGDGVITQKQKDDILDMLGEIDTIARG